MMVLVFDASQRLRAAAYEAVPVALVPLNDPMGARGGAPLKLRERRWSHATPMPIKSAFGKLALWHLRVRKDTAHKVRTI